MSWQPLAPPVTVATGGCYDMLRRAAAAVGRSAGRKAAFPACLHSLRKVAQQSKREALIHSRSDLLLFCNKSGTQLYKKLMNNFN